MPVMILGLRFRFKVNEVDPVDTRLKNLNELHDPLKLEWKS